MIVYACEKLGDTSMSGKNSSDQNEQNETTSTTGSVEPTPSTNNSSSGDTGSDQGSFQESNSTSDTTMVVMPENGLPQLAEQTGLSVDELFEMNKDLLQDKNSFTVGQMVRIPTNKRV